MVGIIYVILVLINWFNFRSVYIDFIKIRVFMLGMCLIIFLDLYG